MSVGYLSQEELKRLLDYNPITGIFTRKVTRCNRAIKGDPAGTINSNGYLFIKIDGRSYRVHHLAFLWMEGLYPKEVDHIDGNRVNNAFANLRKATSAQNAQNRVSKGRLIGTTLTKFGWMARIKVDGRSIFLGNFPTNILAHEAYCKAKREAHQFNPIQRNRQAA